MSWSIFLGSALGVIAGAVIQYIAYFFIDKRAVNRRKRNLLKEIEFNKTLVSSALSETDNLKSAIQSRSLAHYVPNFSVLGQVLQDQLSQFIRDGHIYTYLDETDMSLIFKYAGQTNANLNIHVINTIDDLKSQLRNNPPDIEAIYESSSNLCVWLQNLFRDSLKSADSIQRKLSAK